LIDDVDPAKLEIPRQGAAAPLVMILEAGSYECPYTRKAEPLIEKLLAEFPHAARYYLHNPLPGQKKGYLLALAASAAQRQGRFSELHRLLIGASSELDEDGLLALVRRAELDVSLFLKDMKREEIKQHVERNRALVAALGLTGTPLFIVNGKLVLGLPDEGAFRRLIKEESAAFAALSEDLPLEQRHAAAAAVFPPYRTLLEKGIKWDESIVRSPTDPPPTRFRIESPEPPVLGDAAAPVVVVEYIDMDCPFSKKAWFQAAAYAARNPSAASFRFRLVAGPKGRTPAEVSAQAATPAGPAIAEAADGSELAAAAGVLALRTGRFRQFADAYFERQGTQQALPAACEAAGIADCTPSRLRAPDVQLALDRVRIDAVPVVAAGTPVYYVNGVRRAGLLPDDNLSRLIDEEGFLVRSLSEKGMSVAAAIEFISARGWLLPLVEPQETSLDLAGLAPIANASAVKVQLVLIWDDASPYCKQLWPHIAKLLLWYPGKVEVIQKPYDAATDPAPPPAVYVDGHRLRVPTGTDFYSLAAAIEAGSAP